MSYFRNIYPFGVILSPSLGSLAVACRGSVRNRHPLGPGRLPYAR